MGPFDYVKDISFEKKNLADEDEFETAYVPWIVNKALSNFYDTVLYANEINTMAALDKRMQHDYLFHSISKKKRWSKWPKKNKDDVLELIQEKYHVNINRAKEIAQTLTEEQLGILKNKNNKGGL